MALRQRQFRPIEINGLSAKILPNLQILDAIRWVTRGKDSLDSRHTSPRSPSFEFIFNPGMRSGNAPGLATKHSSILMQSH